jgi:hypothetical protein
MHQLVITKETRNRVQSEALRPVDVEPTSCSQAHLGVVGCDAFLLDLSLSDLLGEGQLRPVGFGFNEQGWRGYSSELEAVRPERTLVRAF